MSYFKLSLKKWVSATQLPSLVGYCLLFLQLCSSSVFGQTKPVLLFVSHEDCYYSEYIVMLKALQAAGYQVDVRSASADSASTYMIPANTDIAATAATLPGGSYLQFTQQFQQLFDSTWNAAWNATPLYIPVNGSIQHVVNMANYSALVVAGGTGVSAYRVTGTYQSQGTGARLLPASVVQAASIKLNQLAIEALQQGKPVLGQCHGAALPAFWRIPGTSGPGIDSIGFSLLRGGFATGFPEPQTSTTLGNLSINFRGDDRVTISNPHSSFNPQGNGNGKVITSRDWYPQTVAHAARTLINVMQTYPTNAVMQAPVSVLILHGGIVDSLNCGPNNKINDVPCNHGVGINLPADYRHLQTLLNANSPNDSFLFNVTQLNLSDPVLPYQANNTSSILNYFQAYDVVVFFKHWSTDVTTQLQNALVQYVDGGGGLLALHHGLYNDSINASFNKNILRSQLFGAESSSNTWSGVNLSNYQLYQTNYGHFISSYGITPSSALSTPAAWSLSPLVNSASTNHSVFHGFNIFDETYNNLTFIPGQQFGRKTNQITPLFSNSVNPGNQMHVAGYAKLVNLSPDTSVGRLVYLQPGERRESIHINHRFGQVIRNAIVWLANNSSISVVPVKMLEPTILCENGWTTLNWITTVEINNSHFIIEASDDGINWQQVGKIKGAGQQKTMKEYTSKTNTNHPFYRINQVDWDGTINYGNTLVAGCFSPKPSAELLLYPNPSTGLIELIPENHLTQEAQINIYSIDGTLVMSKTITSVDGKKYQVDTEQLAAGIYVIAFVQGQHTTHQRLVINK